MGEPDMSDHKDAGLEMSCTELRARVDELLSGEMSREDQVRLFDHAACCDACGTYLGWARDVQGLVSEVAPAEPRNADFDRRVLESATADERPLLARAWPAGVAVAALVALAVVPLTSRTPDEPRLQSAAPLEVWEPQLRQVRLAFSSDQSLQNVRLTLELPDNVELEPFPGRQTLSWHVDLSPGDNVLTLPLRVLYPAEAELVARLDDGGRQKIFRTPIPGGASEPGAGE